MGNEEYGDYEGGTTYRRTIACLLALSLVAAIVGAYNLSKDDIYTATMLGGIGGIGIFGAALMGSYLHR